MAPIAPTVKALAEENGIDLASVTGTGKGGSITKKDVQALIGGGSSSSSSSSSGKTTELYCPGCGARSTEKDATCAGGEFPHAPIAMVPSSELEKGPEHHTPAPNTD